MKAKIKNHNPPGEMGRKGQLFAQFLLLLYLPAPTFLTHLEIRLFARRKQAEFGHLDRADSS